MKLLKSKEVDDSPDYVDLFWDWVDREAAQERNHQAEAGDLPIHEDPGVEEDIHGCFLLIVLGQYLPPPQSTALKALIGARRREIKTKSSLADMSMPEMLRESLELFQGFSMEDLYEKQKSIMAQRMTLWQTRGKIQNALDRHAPLENGNRRPQAIHPGETSQGESRERNGGEGSGREEGSGEDGEYPNSDAGNQKESDESRVIDS